MAKDDPGAQLAQIDFCLLDSGPLIAALDRRDSSHNRVLRALEYYRGIFLTTGAVITEAMHFLKSEREGPENLVGFLVASKTEVRDCFSREQLIQCAALMKKYADVPMDFADASFVLLAEEIGRGGDFHFG